MGDIGNLNEVFQWSISKVSEAFSLDRATVRKRLAEAGIQPAGKLRGNPKYAAADNTLIDCELFYENACHPFTASPDDCAWWRKEIYQFARQGSLGEIAPFEA